MRLLLFLAGAFQMVLAVGLLMGELQKIIKFNSIDSEIFLFLLCFVTGIVFLIYSIFENENRANRY
jgi:hypothetical protein